MTREELIALAKLEFGPGTELYEASNNEGFHWAALKICIHPIPVPGKGRGYRYRCVIGPQTRKSRDEVFEMLVEKYISGNFRRSRT